MSASHVVGISDCKFSRQPSDNLITYALGSCIGLTLYDAVTKAGGMLHLMLPDSRYRAGSREFNPYMYADTGFRGLLAAVLSLGAAKERLVAKLAGGANMLSHSSVLDIGKRNADAILDLLRRERIPIRGQSVGGTVGRSMQLHLNDGAVRVRLLGVGEEVL